MSWNHKTWHLRRSGRIYLVERKYGHRHSDQDCRNKGKTLYIQSGGGIVHDSVPELEWKSLNKGRAIFRAAAMAATNFEIGALYEPREKRD